MSATRTASLLPHRHTEIDLLAWSWDVRQESTAASGSGSGTLSRESVKLLVIDSIRLAMRAR